MCHNGFETIVVSYYYVIAVSSTLVVFVSNNASKGCTYCVAIFDAYVDAMVETYPTNAEMRCDSMAFGRICIVVAIN